MQKIWKNKKKRLSRFYALMALFCLLWHVMLNTFDLWKNPDGEVIVYITAVFGLAVFAQFCPFYTIAYLLSGYVLFLSLNASVLGGGNVVNITIAVIVALAVALTRFNHVRRDLLQQKQIMTMNSQMTREQEKLRLSLEKHKIIMEQAYEVMFDWYLQEDKIVFSRNWEEKFGYPLQICGFLEWLRTVDKLHEPERQSLLSLAEKCMNGCLYEECECQLETAQGEKEWFLIRVSLQFDSNGTPVEGIGILNNIHKQKTEIAQLHSLLRYDSLTGILNRSAVRLYAETCMPQASVHAKVGMFIIDLDNFKRINDTYGHPYGDFILVEIARTMQRLFHENDGVGRIGGDEFAVLLSGVKSHESMEKMAAQLLSKIAEIDWKKDQLKLSCSIGAAISEDPDMCYEELYSQADAALYEAKRKGKNCFSIYPDGLR